MKNRASIRNFLFKRIFITTFIVTIFFCLISYIYTYQTESKKLKHKAEESITKFAKFLEIPLWNFDTQLLEKFSKLLMNEKQICAVKILDETGKVQVAFSDKNCEQISKNNLVVLKKKIFYKSYKDYYLGEVFVTFSMAHVTNQLVKLTLSNVLLFVSLLFILLLITHHSINSFVLLPLNVLNKYVKNISGGNYNELIKEKFEYEFENIKEAFNQMVINIREYNNELVSINEKIKTLLDTIPDAVFILDKGEYINIIESNQTAEILFGYNSNELKNVDVDELLGDIFLDIVESDTLFELPDDSVLEFESTGKNNLGNNIPISVRLKTIILNDMDYIMAIVTDISKRKEAEKTVVSEKEKLNVTLMSITDGVIVTDEQSRIVMLNKPAQVLLNVRENEAYLKQAIQYINLIEISKNQDEHPILKVVKSKKSVFFEDKMECGDNKVISVEGSCSPIMFNSEFLGTIIIIKDVTEKEIMEQEILKSQKLESLGLLAGGIAHDFNNLLLAIENTNNLIRLHADNDKKIKRYTSDISSILKKATGLTNQLLTFSKGGSPVKDSLNIVDIVNDTAKFILSGTAIKLKIDYDEDLWPAYVDYNQISQVIHNLILNSKQALKNKGNISIKFENHLCKDEDNIYLLEIGKYVKIEIQDDGPGIKEEIRDKVFDPFFTTKEKGNGIGLSTVHSIIKKHNGHIEVAPSDTGAKFVIFLPASDEVKKKVNIVEEKDNFEISLKILILDDDEVIRRSLAELLEFLGHSTVTVEDGKLAIERYKEAFNNGEPFDLLILDLTVPGGMGGEEALKEILLFDKNAVAIVSSGYSEDEIMSDYEKFGFKGVMPKPFRLEQISEIIKKLFVNKI